MGCFPSRARASDCVAPSQQKQAQVTSYLTTRYHIAASSSFHLVNLIQANEECYWKFSYEIPETKRDITWYLSPSGQYLSPTLYDIRLDPLEEERSRNDQLMKSLLSGDPPSRGPVNAPVTIVEFSDFECPYCKRFTDTLEKEVLPSEQSNVRVVFRNFPLSIHPWAKAAAQMEECAALQKPEAFWALNDYFFENQKSLTFDNLNAQVTLFVAGSPYFDKSAFHSCEEKELGIGLMMQDMDLGKKYGIHLTPTYFINGVRFEGAKNAIQLRALIDAAARGEVLTSPDDGVGASANAPGVK